MGNCASQPGDVDVKAPSKSTGSAPTHLFVDTRVRSEKARPFLRGTQFAASQAARERCSGHCSRPPTPAICSVYA